MAPTGETPSGSRGGRTKTKSVRKLMEPPSGTPPLLPCPGSTSKRLASQKPSASPSSSRTPAPPSARGSSTPSETSITNVGTSGSSATPITNLDVQIQGDEAATPITNPDVQIQGDDLEEDEEDDEDQEQAQLTGKRRKRCTSEVWKYFTKKVEVVEVNGQKYEQLWGYCNFPKCKQRYRAEGNHGTTGFKNHLKSQHSIVKGQQQLKVG